MSTEGNSRLARTLKRRQINRDVSIFYTDSSSDEELAPRSKKLVPNLVWPGSTGEACSELRSTTKNSTVKRASEKNSTGASVGMLDLDEFSKSLIEDFKVKSEKMLAQFKKDLRNVVATNSTETSTKNRGKHMSNTRQAQVQKSPHTALPSVPSEPQQDQHMISSSAKNFIPPAGGQFHGSVVCASSTEFNHGRENLMKNAANRPGYQVQVQKIPQYYEPQHEPPLIISTSRNFIPPARQSAGNTGLTYTTESLTPNAVNGHGYFINNLLAQLASDDNSSLVDTLGWNLNGGPTMFHGSSHALSNTSTVPANRYSAIDYNINVQANEAWLRMHGHLNGSL